MNIIYVFQDIMENEDVKLDNMFIASLVADIIRVRKYYVTNKYLYGNIMTFNFMTNILNKQNQMKPSKEMCLTFL